MQNDWHFCGNLLRPLNNPTREEYEDCVDGMFAAVEHLLMASSIIPVSICDIQRTVIDE